jgi:hypothetical protein
MAWRPNEYFIAGELDNTVPGKVTGWMHFAGIPEKVTFDLKGDFHRDIRGARIRLTGDGHADDPEAAEYMQHFALHQTGDVGDMTAGLPPYDYTKGRPYVEWYGDSNGRVVLEPDPHQVELLTTPIPWCESDPISRADQARNMANFLAGLAAATRVPAVAVGGRTLISDPAFTHWVVVEDQIIGEAREVAPDQNGSCFAYVRLFQAPECAEHGRIEKQYLRDKAGNTHSDSSVAADKAAAGDVP